MNQYTVIIAVTPDGAHEPRLVLKHVTTTSAPVAIAEATAAVYWQHDAAAPTVGDALVFDGRLEIATQGRRMRRPPAVHPGARFPASSSTRRTTNGPGTFEAGMTRRTAYPQR